MRVNGAGRQVFRHPFGEPERKVHLRKILKSSTRFAARKDVVLKFVHHLVRQDLFEAAIVPSERHEDSVT